MRVQYAPRARADLAEIGDYSRRTFGPRVAAALRTYIRLTLARVALMPESGEEVPERPGVRVVSLVRYPFRIFYTFDKNNLTILHIRHTARQPWIGEAD
jgi:toxin ParE1/3/4